MNFIIRITLHMKKHFSDPYLSEEQHRIGLHRFQHVHLHRKKVTKEHEHMKLNCRSVDAILDQFNLASTFGAMSKRHRTYIHHNTIGNQANNKARNPEHIGGSSSPLILILISAVQTMEIKQKRQKINPPKHHQKSKISMAASSATKGSDVRRHAVERSIGIGAATAMAVSSASKDASMRKPGAERRIRGGHCQEDQEQTNGVRTGWFG
ncbi:hypothetical protein VPH35_008611 [Triticum aestivum]